MAALASRIATRVFCLSCLSLTLIVSSASDAGAQAEPEYKRIYRTALDAARAGQVDEAYTLLVRSSDLARKAGDSLAVDQTGKMISQIDYNRGVQRANAENYAEALQHFDAGIKRYPAFGKNHIGKGEALKHLGRHREAVAAFQGAADHPDAEIAVAARDGIRDNLLYMASVALSRNGERVNETDAREALKYLLDLQKYEEPDADVLFYIGQSYKVLGDHAKALESADSALQLHEGSKAEKAKLYFLKGEALVFAGDKDGARAAFSEARYGEYKAAAERYLATL